MPAPLTPEQLLLFHEELASLVRMGSPLEPGLRRLGRDLPGKLGQLGERLSVRLQEGKSLQQALAEEPQPLPENYRHVLAIGEESGKLNLALEALIRMTQQMIDLRRLVGLSFIYPVVVLAFAYLLFLLFLSEFWERYRVFIDDLHIPATPWMQNLAAMSASVERWWWIPPVVVCCGWLIHRWSARRNLLKIGVGFGMLPGVLRLRRQWNLTQFTELLAALVEQEVPLDRGLILAAEMSGDVRLNRSAVEQVQVLKAGEKLATSRRRGIPQYLLWLLGTAGSREQLVRNLRGAADLYRRRAMRQAYALKYLLPGGCMVLLGGGAVCAYLLIVYQPIVYLLTEISKR